MAVKAYVLVETAPGTAGEIVTALSEMTGITAADAVTGPYDIVVIAEAPNLNAIGKKVVSQIQKIEGVTRTITSVVINL